MGLTLENIVLILEQVFKKIDGLQDKDLVIMLGNSGDGKTTALSSLVHGPDALQEKTVTELMKIEVAGITKEKKMKSKIIEFKEGVESKFVINHSQSTSRTFIPAFEPDETSGLLYVDVGGFNDDNMGPLIEILNTMTINHIFHNAKSLRFIITHTLSKIEALKGPEAKNYMSLLRSLIPSGSSGPIPHSIQPILTRVEKKTKNFVHMRKLFAEQLQNECRREKEKRDQENEKNGKGADEAEEEYKARIEAVEAEHKLFADYAEEFAGSLQMFDPKDRPVPTKELNEGIPRDKLVESLLSLTPIEDSARLSLPLRPDLLIKLQELFQGELQLAVDLAQDFINQS